MAWKFPQASMMTVVVNKTASKLQKLVRKTKPALPLFALAVLLGGLPPLKAQNFPSQARPTVSAHYTAYPAQAGNDAFAYPLALSVRIMMEFRQIYALHAGFSAGAIQEGQRIVPTVGLDYDLLFKLFRSDPQRTFTPVLGFGFSKQWAATNTNSEQAGKLLGDFTNWRFQALGGVHIFIDRESAGFSSHTKLLAGATVLLGPREYLGNALYPNLSLIVEL